MQNILKILIIDDDQVDRIAVRRALKTFGETIEISEADDYKSAVMLLKSHSFHCIFLDYRLPDKDG